MDKLKLTNELNDALLEEVKENEQAITILKGKEKKHLEAIKSLEEKIAKLKTEKDLKSSECQTFSEQIQIPCSKCLHVSSCEEEFTWHMDEYHDIQSDSFFDSDFTCDICGKFCRSKSDLDHHQKKHETSVQSNECTKYTRDSCSQNFESKRMLMQHKKAFHKEKVNVCWNFSAGKCDFGDELCWFIHCENSEEKRFKEIKCSTCENVFDNMNNFLQHNKREHRDKVQMCKNKDSCLYQNCWFRHNTYKEQNEQQHDTISTTKGLFWKRNCSNEGTFRRRYFITARSSSSTA